MSQEKHFVTISREIFLASEIISMKARNSIYPDNPLLLNSLTDIFSTDVFSTYVSFSTQKLSFYNIFRLENSPERGFSDISKLLKILHRGYKE